MIFNYFYRKVQLVITKRKLFYSLTPGLRYFIRRIYFFPVDFFSFISGKRSKLIPPKGLIFIGSGDFKILGDHYLNVFIEHCGLMPSDNVLDIGCGIGRIAIPLTSYLNSDGSYEGFDIVKKGIDWCSRHITKSFPNFKFLHIDLKNDLYNLKTENAASNFVFPYDDNNFDLVILTSVFTHMMPQDIENYMEEINRVLKPKGRCLVTFFILNAESKEFMASGSDFNFKISYGNYSLIDKNVKEANVGYEEKYIFNLIERNGFSIQEILYGFWSGRPKSCSFDFQDTFILTKS